MHAYLVFYNELFEIIPLCKMQVVCQPLGIDIALT